jgi:hypothetical protein
MRLNNDNLLAAKMNSFSTSMMCLVVLLLGRNQLINHKIQIFKKSEKIDQFQVDNHAEMDQFHVDIMQKWISFM